jgi:hypothetical protein
MVAVNQRRLEKKKGQTVVEYIMLLVVVTALFFLFQSVGAPFFNDIFSTSKLEVEKTAMRGGKAAVQNYYADGEKSVVGR